MLPLGHYQYVGYELLWMFILHHADPLSLGSYFPVIRQLLSPASSSPAHSLHTLSPRRKMGACGIGLLWVFPNTITQNSYLTAITPPLKNTMRISTVTSVAVGKEIIFVIFLNQWKRRKKLISNLRYFWQSQLLHTFNPRYSHLQP